MYSCYLKAEFLASLLDYVTRFFRNHSYIITQCFLFYYYFRTINVLLFVLCIHLVSKEDALKLSKVAIKTISISDKSSSSQISIHQ